MLRCTLLVGLISLLFCCSSESEYADTDVEIVGHAGAGFASMNNPLPPNSLESILRAIALGADGVEVDLKIAKDSTIWLYHDQYLEQSTTCSGCVGELTAEELLNCRYKTGSASGNYAEHRLVPLSTLLTEFNGLSSPPLVSFDIKFSQCGPEHAFANALHSLLLTYNAKSWTEITGFSLELMETMKSLDSTYTCLLESKTPESSLDKIIQKELDGVVANELDFTPTLSLQYQQAGLKIALFGLSNRSNSERALLLEPDQVQTDNVELIRALIK